MELKKYTKYICHRKPERSFFYKGHQFPVCARCTGFYISGILSIIILKFYPIDFNYMISNSNYFGIIILLSISVLLLIPAGVDGTTQLLKKRESNNRLRLITGLLGGLGLILLYHVILFIILMKI